MWPNPQFPVDFVIFTEEILNEKLLFCAVPVLMFLSHTSARFIWVFGLGNWEHIGVTEGTHWVQSQRSREKPCRF